MLSTNEEFY